MRHALLPFLVAVAFVLSPGSAHASAIQYDLTNLGGNSWQYDYYFSGPINAQQGFRVYFDFDASNLQVLPPATPGWDPLVTNPDPVLTSLGTYDALALVNSPAFSGPFRVSFLWSGAGAPGSQNFDVYTLDASGFPDPFETGVTTPRTVTPPPVPEPSTFLLVATGIAAVRKLRRKREPSAP
jgi:hypothetical protein